MASLDDWGKDPNMDDTIGDAAYEKIEDKAKSEAKNLTGKALDKVTDHIKPVKKVKDGVKNLYHNNPIAKAKRAVQGAINRVKDSAKNVAAKGMKGAAKAAKKGAKHALGFAARHPVITLIIVLIVFIILGITSVDDSDDSSSDAAETEVAEEEHVLLESPTYVDLDALTDNEIAVILMDDCVDQQYDNMGDISVEKEETATYIYSIFRSMGFNNASIAGILGNMDCESSLDPTGIEGIMSEHGRLGTRKAEALLSITNYTENTLFPNYNKNGVGYDKDSYKVTGDNGEIMYYCGVGLGQWTAGRAYTLFSSAETLGVDWYSMDFQLAYALSVDTRSSFFDTWVADQEEGEDDDDDSWIEAARESGIRYAHDWEGNTAHDDERADAAEAWFQTIKDWDDSAVNQEYVDSITSLASELGSIINFLDVENAQYRCLNGNVFDNSSLASAAVSFAWPTKDQSYNNGTNLYQIVHDGVYPGDHIYKACDRAVGMAVKWSGTDIDYTWGTVNQLSYLINSPKWEEVGLSSSLDIEDLQPGDVFIVRGSESGHTFIYVGEELITSAYKDEATSGSDSVSASLSSNAAKCRSAACDRSAGGMIRSNGGMDWDGRGAYHVFRCVAPDNSDMYKSLGSGVS